MHQLIISAAAEGDVNPLVPNAWEMLVVFVGFAILFFIVVRTTGSSTALVSWAVMIIIMTLTIIIVFVIIFIIVTSSPFSTWAAAFALNRAFGVVDDPHIVMEKIVRLYHRNRLVLSGAFSRGNGCPCHVCFRKSNVVLFKREAFHSKKWSEGQKPSSPSALHLLQSCGGDPSVSRNVPLQSVRYPFRPPVHRQV